MTSLPIETKGDRIPLGWAVVTIDKRTGRGWLVAPTVYATEREARARAERYVDRQPSQPVARVVTVYADE